MRNVIFGILVVFFALLSCRSDEDSIQRIDQTLNLYMRNSAGVDLLNPKKSGAYTSIVMNDFNGLQDIAPVNFALRATADSTLYIEYVDGARRVIANPSDSISPQDRTYESRIRVDLRTASDTISDVLRIQYHWTPSVFEISRVFYNNEPVFTKQPGVPNVVRILK
ncbi:hypothetical protein IQ37_09255 [Chryseobacterium piperi]|uniref:Uncharacterized protein n=1 Tax=Chryseobacterium piperi TaxID=558152 RepID=A0A086BIF5_9FLAO|nr:hypothetical protein [Chryseobacterium piperi]ASW75545.1 hypothetical protein CJF12_15490 [Chryseobacterium piperi]KFF28719.1 hypothetical protein IQ37_09255 [Chryseobacterium piperi]